MNNKENYELIVRCIPTKNGAELINFKKKR